MISTSTTPNTFVNCSLWASSLSFRTCHACVTKQGYNLISVIKLLQMKNTLMGGPAAVFSITRPSTLPLLWNGTLKALALRGTWCWDRTHKQVQQVHTGLDPSLVLSSASKQLLYVLSVFLSCSWGSAFYQSPTKLKQNITIYKHTPRDQGLRHRQKSKLLTKWEDHKDSIEDNMYTVIT